MRNGAKKKAENNSKGKIEVYRANESLDKLVSLMILLNGTKKVMD